MKLIHSFFSDKIVADGQTAKDKQLAFIKNSLKPFLKNEGFNTSGNKWWKIEDPFFNLIELQNFSWNSKDSVDFTFNFTTGFVKDIENIKKPTIHDGITYYRENMFGVTSVDYGRDLNGYHIDSSTDLDKFSNQTLAHFNLLILPKLNQLYTREAIEGFYTDNFWGPRIRQSLDLGYKNVRIDELKK